MRHSLTPAALRYIDQVARSGSIQQAARELHVAASAVNRQILQMEEELGVPLFDRLPRGMRLTPPGDALVTLARRWREDERRLGAAIRQMQGVHQGQVRMMAMDSHATSAMPRLVEALAVAHPRVSLSADMGSTDDAVSALLAGQIELAAVFNLEPRRELVTLWSAPLPLGCVVAPGHPLAAGDSSSLQEVCSHAIVLQSKALLIRRYLESHYRWLFGEGPQRVETNSLQLLKQLVLSGRYVALTSELDTAAELAAGTLRFLPLRDQGVEAQTVDVVIDARKPLSAVARIVARLLSEALEACLAEARAPR